MIVRIKSTFNSAVSLTIKRNRNYLHYNFQIFNFSTRESKFDWACFWHLRRKCHLTRALRLCRLWRYDSCLFERACVVANKLHRLTIFLHILNSWMYFWVSMFVIMCACSVLYQVLSDTNLHTCFEVRAVFQPISSYSFTTSSSIQHVKQCNLLLLSFHFVSISPIIACRA